ncbi:cysteine synthase 2-like [Chenopodium quinoa]|uniref:cysteine synthase 2-like n=1 Tax=Chenopodium quinoa TaxID=63459 RepID=UPI000B76DB75|nr:cysteine synthase 2-like [Chenopodium quinoa]
MAPVNCTNGAMVGCVAVLSLSLATLSYFLFNQQRIFKHPKSKTQNLNCTKKYGSGIVGAIGNTPLIRINSLSDATGCEILGKAEFLNPGGSVKDRIAVKIIEEALASGQLAPGGVVTEGSAGSTAISLATVAPAYGCKCHVVIPDDVAIEKSQIIEALGATVERVRPVSITHRDHFVNVARRRASEANEQAAKYGKNSETPNRTQEQTNGEIFKEQKKNYTFSRDCTGGFFADQFENLANFRAHCEGTGPEIWEQTEGKLHAFVAAAGTGGTLAGVSHFLKEKNDKIKCFLIDPPGSGLFNRVTRGVMYSKEEAEGKRLKNPFDTIIEGIGINRLTHNFMKARLDGAFRGTDKEAVEMSRFLLKNDGIFLGSSSAMNCVGAVRVAQALGPGHTIVTILCDNGMRHLSRFYKAEYLSELGLTPSASGLEFLGLL